MNKRKSIAVAHDLGPAHRATWLAVWLLAAALGATLQTVAADPQALAWRRDAIGVDAVWRALIGPWMHLSWQHLGLNLVGLAVVLSMFERLVAPWKQWFALLLIAPATCATLYWAFPAAAWMVGLSGPLHGLFAWCAVQLLAARDPAPQESWWHGPKFGWILLAGLAAKLAAETAMQNSVAAPSWLGGPVLFAAHRAGVLAGIAVALLWLMATYLATSPMRRPSEIP